MKRDYNRDLFKNIEELQQSLASLKSEFTTYRVNATETIEQQAEKIERLTQDNQELRQENQKLRLDNERLKRIINNNSSNSSLPPSTDQKPSKPANTYNLRQKSGKPSGGQIGHKGKTLTREKIEELLSTGRCEHLVEDLGDITQTYVSRYVVDIESRFVIREFRIHADGKGCYAIPPELNSVVTYGNELKALCVSLRYNDISLKRTAELLSNITNNQLNLSEGTVSNIIEEFSEKSKPLVDKICETLLNSEVLHTDATNVSVNGYQEYIRNQSTPDAVLYAAMPRKSIEELKKIPVLSKYTGLMVHDHETALFHFGTQHAECGAHILRYLKKNSEETSHKWSTEMMEFLADCNRQHKICIQEKGIPLAQTNDWNTISSRYDSLIAEGRKENSTLSLSEAKNDEARLLNRLAKYKENHLLFAHRTDVDFTNNLSERDLRKCKNRQKVSGGFRTEQGLDEFCIGKSVIETMKRVGISVFEGIKNIFANTNSHLTPIKV